MSLRLLPNQMRDLRAVAKKHGQSLNAFVETIVLRAIADEEERRGLAKEEEQRPRLSDGPTSMLIETLRQRNQALSAPPPVHATPAQGQVVVNVGGSSAFGGSEIERLAMFVTNAKDDIERNKN